MMVSANEMAEGIVLTESGARAVFTITDTQTVMVIRAEHAPVEAELDGAGDYEVDAEEFAKGAEWPIVLLIVPKAHVVAFSKMTPEQVATIIRGASRNTRGAQ